MVAPRHWTTRRVFAIFVLPQFFFIIIVVVVYEMIVDCSLLLLLLLLLLLIDDHSVGRSVGSGRRAHQ